MLNKRKKTRMLREAFRLAGADKIIYVYLVYFLIAALILYRIEPEISSFGASIWYCFAVATTVGFGDIAAATPAGRIITMILSVYSIGVVAILTAVITSYFMDIAKARASDSAQAFLDDLEHLPELSKEELQAVSERVKKFKQGDRSSP